MIFDVDSIFFLFDITTVNTKKKFITKEPSKLLK